VVQEKDVLYAFCNELYEHGDEVLSYIKFSKFLVLTEWLLTSQRGHLLHETNFTVASFPACAAMLNLQSSGMLCSVEW
jgi:hypothetical protein